MLWRSWGLNPSTLYWVDIVSIIFFVKIVMFVWKDENKQKEAWDGPFFNNRSTNQVGFVANLENLLIRTWSSVTRFGEIRHFGIN